MGCIGKVQFMNFTPKPAQERLIAIARRAMVERGFLPDLSPEALHRAAPAGAPAARLREAGGTSTTRRPGRP
jgi:hypothetical protein